MYGRHRTAISAANPTSDRFVPRLIPNRYQTGDRNAGGGLLDEGVGEGFVSGGAGAVVAFDL